MCLRQQKFDAFARRQLAGFVLALAALRAAAGFRFRIQPAQMLEFFFVGHFLVNQERRRQLAKNFLSANFQSNRPDIFRLRTDQLVLRVLLDHVRAPTGHAAARKHRHELRRLQPKRLQHQRRIKLHIRPQISSGLRFRQNSQRRLLNRNRQIIKLTILQPRLAQVPPPLYSALPREDRARDTRDAQIP